MARTKTRDERKTERALPEATKSAAKVAARLADGMASVTGLDQYSVQAEVEALLCWLKTLGIEPRRPEDFGE